MGVAEARSPQTPLRIAGTEPHPQKNTESVRAEMVSPRNPQPLDTLVAKPPRGQQHWGVGGGGEVSHGRSACASSGSGQQRQPRTHAGQTSPFPERKSELWLLFSLKPSEDRGFLFSRPFLFF